MRADAAWAAALVLIGALTVEVAAQELVPVPPLRQEPSGGDGPYGPSDADMPKGALPIARPEALEGEPPEAEIEDVVSEEGTPEERTTCQARLAELDVSFTLLEPIAGRGGCGLPAPLDLSAIGNIRLQGPTTLNCATAEALATWVRDHAVPAARRHLDAEPNAIAIGSSYVCRTRNSRPGARLSEHATGNGVDVMSFGFPERDSVAVAAFDAELPEYRFLAEIRAAACDLFTTVLGPGSDAAHANHFHLDLRQRKNGYRLCE